MGEEEKIKFDTTVVSRLISTTVELELFIKSTGQGMLGDIWNAWNTSPLLLQGIIVEILLGGFISLEGRDLWREMQLSEPAMVLLSQDQCNSL